MTKDEMVKFCPGGTVSQIECRDAVTRDDYLSLQEATCTIEDGLTCENMIALGIECRDYEIRYMCECSGMAFLNYHFAEYFMKLKVILP